jgi:hypothetical protein
MVIWAGDDDTGQVVASGVYSVQLRTDRRLVQRNITLIR